MAFCSDYITSHKVTDEDLHQSLYGYQHLLIPFSQGHKSSELIQGHR